jgi:hypothetical protein
MYLRLKRSPQPSLGQLSPLSQPGPAASAHAIASHETEEQEIWGALSELENRAAPEVLDQV